MFSLKEQKDVPMTARLLFALDALGVHTGADV